MPEPSSDLRILFVTGNYPSASRPAEGTFVQQFVWAMARQGNDCTALKPTSVFDRRYGPYPPERVREDAGAGAAVEVLRPRYLSFSCRNLGATHTGRWTQTSFTRAVVRTARRERLEPDVVYGHFLYHAGAAAACLARRLGAVSVVGVGEGTFWTVDPFGWQKARRDLGAVSGFLAVASHIKNGLLGHLGVAEARVRCEPNGVDLGRFAPVPRAAARRAVGLTPEAFVIGFVGAFDDLKGGEELIEATRDLDGVELFMLGHGPRAFDSPRLRFQGRVPQDLIPLWLGAADVFVLPTKEEGSCNAVLEAMACGLPIVTSNGAYMDDIVDDDVAIRVDPMDVRAIRGAVLALKNDPERRRRMSEACLRKAKRFDINQRARRVTAWMHELVREHKRRGRGESA